MAYSNLSTSELLECREKLRAYYKELQELHLKLDLSRGKPCDEQIKLSKKILNNISYKDFEQHTSYLNYGSLEGIEPLRQLFAHYFNASISEVILGGNSSLELMHLVMSQLALNLPALSDGQKYKWLCPVPGYDRHFRISEALGFENIPVSMDDEGPCIHEVQELVQDPLVCGMWCTPYYHNPSGICYSSQRIHMLADMPASNKSFAIIWDMAYMVHHLSKRAERLHKLPSVIDIMKHYDEQDDRAQRFYCFASTSKITVPGAGVSACASSEHSMKKLQDALSVATIGFDKVNQLRHVKFLKSPQHITRHMRRHAKIIAPKFKYILKTLENELTRKGFQATWHAPCGGYFIAFQGVAHSARKTVELCKAAGLVLTPAGATHPSGYDKDDAWIRLAPTYAHLEELKVALQIFTTAYKLVLVEQYLTNKE